MKGRGIQARLKNRRLTVYHVGGDEAHVVIKSKMNPPLEENPTVFVKGRCGVGELTILLSHEALMALGHCIAEYFRGGHHVDTPSDEATD